LNNSVSDSTYLGERLSYAVFRAAGLPAQRANSATVAINGQSYGLYVNLETPNREFLQRVFPGTWKSLYEINYGSEWSSGVELGFEEQVGDTTKADVAALFQAVDGRGNQPLLTALAPRLDTTEWLRFSAAEAAVGDYDGYAFSIYGSHNYFMAADTAGVFRLVPWSLDLTMSDRISVVNAAQPRPIPNSGPTMLGYCKTDAGCWAQYKIQVNAVLAAYSALSLPALAQTWHAQIDPYVVADPKTETPLVTYTADTALLYD
jgi:spore coat protein CotH